LGNLAGENMMISEKLEALKKANHEKYMAQT
jgi:hypothetical protein